MGWGLFWVEKHSQHTPNLFLYSTKTVLGQDCYTILGGVFSCTSRIVSSTSLLPEYSRSSMESAGSNYPFLVISPMPCSTFLMYRYFKLGGFAVLYRVGCFFFRTSHITFGMVISETNMGSAGSNFLQMYRLRLVGWPAKPIYEI